MNAYVDLYMAIYDSNDLHYVIKEVSKFNMKFASNLSVYEKWNDQSLVLNDLKLGSDINADTVAWVYRNIDELVASV